MASQNSNIIGRSFGDRVLYGLVILLAIVMAAPVLYVIALSLKDNNALMVDPHSVFQLPYTIKNYIDTIGTSSVFLWVFNSIVVAGGMTIMTLILSSLAGYGFARLNFPGRDVLFVLVLLGLAVPEQAVLIARHQIFSWLGLHNSYPGLILPGLSSAFGVFLMTQYFRAIPKELDEAAILDNASRFRVFWKVLLPLTVPARRRLASSPFSAPGTITSGR